MVSKEQRVKSSHGVLPVHVNLPSPHKIESRGRKVMAFFQHVSSAVPVVMNVILSPPELIPAVELCSSLHKFVETYNNPLMVGRVGEEPPCQVLGQLGLV